MAEVGLELLGTLIRRLDDKIDRVREDIADRKTDMEVTAALVRRLDSSVQGLTGEVRALRSQQDRQRRRPLRGGVTRTGGADGERYMVTSSRRAAFGPGTRAASFPSVVTLGASS